MLFGICVVLYVIICIILCLLILVQSDKGGGLSGALGGGLSSAQSLLGTQDTANILTRGTVIFGSAFMVLSIVLALFLGRGHGAMDQKSLLKARAEKQENFAPSSILDEGQLPVENQGGEGGAQSGVGSPIDLQGAAQPAQQPAAPAEAGVGQAQKK